MYEGLAGCTAGIKALTTRSILSAKLVPEATVHPTQTMHVRDRHIVASPRAVTPLPEHRTLPRMGCKYTTLPLMGQAPSRRPVASADCLARDDRLCFRVADGARRAHYIPPPIRVPCRDVRHQKYSWVNVVASSVASSTAILGITRPLPRGKR